MNILYCCRRLPHAQARDSGRQDTYHYIKQLAQTHDITLITFVDEDDKPFVSEMEALCRQVVAIPFDENALSGRLWRLVCRQLFTKVYGREVHLGYRQALGHLLQNNHFDLAIVDGVMALYGAQISKEGIPTVLDEVDLFAAVAYQLYRKETRPLTRFHLWQDWLRTLSQETGFWRSYDGLLVRSHKDAAYIKELEPDRDIHVVPIWFEGMEDLGEISAKRPANNKILFMGSMGLAPNIEAATYFADEIFPTVQRRVPDAEFYIVGSRPHPDVLALGNRPGITVTGEVDDLTPYYEMAAVNVVPLLVGGGIICKTLNGLAAARPTVSTTLGNSGTTAADGDALIIRDTPDRFAQETIRLLTDQTAWNRFASRGRAFIEETYDWERDMRSFDLFLREITANPPL